MTIPDQIKDRAKWRYGGPPNYTVTRELWVAGVWISLMSSDTADQRSTGRCFGGRSPTGLTDFLGLEKQSNHDASSLESLVENLVKNWEIEASHKTDVHEWRTVDAERYTFAINGGKPQDAKHMLKV